MMMLKLQKGNFLKVYNNFFIDHAGIDLQINTLREVMWTPLGRAVSFIENPKLEKVRE